MIEDKLTSLEQSVWRVSGYIPDLSILTPAMQSAWSIIEDKTGYHPDMLQAMAITRKYDGGELSQEQEEMINFLSLIGDEIHSF